jgi:N-acetylglucosamine kinase-like BadF-type ATPase
MNYLLGVDGGGSKTTVQIADTSGKVISQAVSGSSSYKSVGINRAIGNLNTAVFDAIKKLKVPIGIYLNTAVFDAIKKLKVSRSIYFISSCFGFAGHDAGEGPKIYKKIVFNKKLRNYLNPRRTIICNDTRIGLKIGSESKNKIIIIAGAGSNCFGINEDGKEALASGWDFILADEGSGYSVGLKALKAIMKAYDGRGEKTLLSKTILEKLDLNEIPDLIKWAYGGLFSKDKISRLAETVGNTAKMGDKVSIDILAEEAEEDVISVITVADKLGFKDKDFDLVLVGGLFECEEYFKNILIKKLRENFPKITFMPLVENPAGGAIKMAKNGY